MSLSATVTAIIPASYDSERLPGKPLRSLGPRTLIEQVCRNVSKAGACGRIVVATDHEEIIQVVQRAGYEAVRTASSLPSGTDRVAAAASMLALPDNELILNVQGDEPFVSADILRLLSERLRARPAQVVTAVEPILEAAHLQDPNRVKVVLDAEERALYFSRSPIPYVRGADSSVISDLHLKHIGIYGYSAATLRRLSALPPSLLEQTEKLEQLRWLENGITISCVRTGPTAPGVDTPADLEAARSFLAILEGGVH